MRLGAPVFLDTDDPEELARAHRALGYRAAFCPPLNVGETDRIRTVREAFAKHDVVIAEVGVWNNLMEPDGRKREANLAAMEQGLAVADEAGALCAVNIAGTFNPRSWAGPHPDNFSAAAFDLAVTNARAVIDSVRPKRAKLTYEMMPWCLPDSTDAYLELIRAVDRPAFAVHLDVVNIVNSPRRYFENTSLIRECFAKLGPRIVVCHLKDVLLDERLTVHLDEVIAGEGGLDIKAYLEEVARLPHQPPILLEHLRAAEEFDRARTHVLRVAKDAGIDFES
jgi:sugar phosphate isomerase/epimerase